MIGFYTLIIAKGLKYSTSDPTKEIAYLYLDNEKKYKAKIAVELLGSRFGKVFSGLFNIIVTGIIYNRAFVNQSEIYGFVFFCHWSFYLD